MLQDKNNYELLKKLDLNTDLDMVHKSIKNDKDVIQIVNLIINGIKYQGITIK